MTSSTDIPPVAEVDPSTKASDDEKPQGATQNEDNHASGSRLALIMMAILLAMFLVALV